MKRVNYFNKLNLASMNFKVLLSIIALFMLFNEVALGNDKIKKHYARVISSDSLLVSWEGLDPSAKYIRLFKKQYPNVSYEYIDYDVEGLEDFECYVTGLNMAEEKYVFYSRILDENQEPINTIERFSPLFMSLTVTATPDPNFSNDPEIRFSKYWWDEVSTNKVAIYRKIEGETRFVLLSINTISTEEDLVFIDTTMNAVCGKQISYYLGSGNGQSLSQERSEEYTENHPPESPLMKKLSVEKGDLIIDWSPSVSEDVDYYYIRMKNEYGNWTPLPGVQSDSISVNDSSFVVKDNYCNVIGYDYYACKVFAMDRCGNTSLEIDDDYLSPLSFEKAEYDGCNTFSLRWSDKRCLRNTEYYKLLIVNFIGDTIYYGEIAEHVEGQEVYEHLFNNVDEDYYGNLILTIVACNNAGEKAYSCSINASVLSASEPPEYMQLLSVKYIDETKNKLTMKVDSTFDGIYRLYRRFTEYSEDNTSTSFNLKEIFSFEANRTIVEYIDLIEQSEGLPANNIPYTYILKSENECGVIYDDTVAIRSIYLSGDKNSDINKVQLCFSSIDPDDENPILDYTIIVNDDETEFYNGNICSQEFINECHAEQSLYHCNNYISRDFFKTYQVIAKMEEEPLVQSISNKIVVNLVIIDHIKMPNAIVVNGYKAINAKFQPLNMPQFMILGIKKYDFRIYNSWGEMVWHSNDYETKPYWEGKSDKDVSLSEGTYLYSIVIEVVGDDEVYVDRGTVTLFNK